jgi:hypothetical protein
MIARYDNLCRYPAVFRSLTGLRRAEFDALVREVAPLVAAAEHQRHLVARTPSGAYQPRRRASGAGPPFKLTERDQLLLVIVWLRQYPTHEVLGFLFGVSDSVVSRLVARLVPVLAQAGRDTMRLPDPGRKHRRDLDALLAHLPELGVVIDSFEQPVQRPARRAEADRWYSGKKKRHTIKSQVGVDRHTGEVVDVAESVRGPTADITVLKQSGLLGRVPPGVSAEGDLAYVGIAQHHPQGLGFTPRRKPRGKDKHRERGQDQAQSAEDGAYNQAFARSRIIVEHTIGRLRRYQALSATDRHHREGHTARVQAVAGLVNRQMRARMPYLQH